LLITTIDHAWIAQNATEITIYVYVAIIIVAIVVVIISSMITIPVTAIVVIVSYFPSLSYLFLLIAIISTILLLWSKLLVSIQLINLQMLLLSPHCNDGWFIPWIVLVIIIPFADYLRSTDIFNHFTHIDIPGDICNVHILGDIITLILIRCSIESNGISTDYFIWLLLLLRYQHLINIAAILLWLFGLFNLLLVLWLLWCDCWSCILLISLLFLIVIFHASNRKRWIIIIVVIVISIIPTTIIILNLDCIYIFFFFFLLLVHATFCIFFCNILLLHPLLLLRL